MMPTRRAEFASLCARLGEICGLIKAGWAGVARRRTHSARCKFGAADSAIIDGMHLLGENYDRKGRPMPGVESAVARKGADARPNAGNLTGVAESTPVWIEAALCAVEVKRARAHESRGLIDGPAPSLARRRYLVRLNGPGRL